MADRYGADVLADDPHNSRKVRSVECPAEIGMVVEDPQSGYVGAIVRVEGGRVELEDRKLRVRVFPLGPGFLVDGRPVILIAPRAAAPAVKRTASGSVKVAPPASGARAKVALQSRIYVEGRHDAELVEQVWGYDLRIEGVVVEYLGGVDDLVDIVASFRPGPGRRLGVLVDHLVPGSKEARIAEAVRRGPGGEHTLVVGHPYVDIWQAVKPDRVGLTQWPSVPRTVEWKVGICQALGLPHRTQADIARAWQRIRGSVRDWTDLQPELIGRVEELIDFVTQPVDQSLASPQVSRLSLKEPTGLLIGGIAAGVAGVMADLLSPIYATSFHKGFGLSSTQAGFLVTAALGMMAVAEFGLAHSIAHRNLKHISTYGVAISVVSLLYISEVSDNGFWSLFAGMIGLGLGCGLTFVAGNAALSYANNSERAFGLLTFWYMIFVFVMMSSNPYLRELYPIVLPYAAMVVVQLLCLALVWWKLPDTRLIAAQRAAAAQAVGESVGTPGSAPGGLKLFSPLPILLGLAVTLSQVALAGLWTFAQELGRTAGLSAETTASFLGASQLIGLLGTVAPWLLGRWIGRAALGAAGFLLAAAGIIMVCIAHDPTGYIVGNLLTNLGYWVTLPLSLSIAADLDRSSGRLVAFMLGMSSVGLAIGPSIAGPLLGGADTTLGAWVFGLLGLVAVPLIVPPALAADRAARATAELAAAEAAAGAIPG